MGLVASLAVLGLTCSSLPGGVKAARQTPHNIEYSTLSLEVQGA